MLTDKITFLLTNKKIRNILIIVIFAFSLVGVLKHLDLYEGYSGQNIAPVEQTSNETLKDKMDKIDKITENTNKRLDSLDNEMKKASKTNGSESKLEVKKEKI